MGLFRRTTGNEQEATATESAKTVAAEPRHVTDTEFDELISQSEQPVVVDFWAEWCGPCHGIAPFVAKLADEYAGRAVVAKVDADDYPDVLSRYGIMGIPTLIYFKDGREVDRIVGYVQYGALKTKMERLIA